jgi:hypothetical protein
MICLQLCTRAAALRTQVSTFQPVFIFGVVLTLKLGIGVRRHRTSTSRHKHKKCDVLCRYVSAWTCSLEAALLRLTLFHLPPSSSLPSTSPQVRHVVGHSLSIEMIGRVASASALALIIQLEQPQHRFSYHHIQTPIQIHISKNKCRLTIQPPFKRMTLFISGQAQPTRSNSAATACILGATDNPQLSCHLEKIHQTLQCHLNSICHVHACS